MFIGKNKDDLIKTLVSSNATWIPVSMEDRADRRINRGGVEPIVSSEVPCTVVR